MSAGDELRGLLAGRRPAGGLLQTLRLEAAGAEHYGEEAVLERGRVAPLDLAGAAELRAPGHLALFGDTAAAIADLYDERVGRVWALGPGLPAELELAVSVAFDPDLRQARGSVLWDAADHPQAAPALVERLAAAGERLVDAVAREGERPAYRVRAFLIRAFGTSEHGVGLFALHRLGAGPVRPSGWSHAAVLLAPEGERVVRDRAGEAAVGLLLARV